MPGGSAPFLHEQSRKSSTRVSIGDERIHTIAAYAEATSTAFAIDRLLAHGVPRERIGVLMKERSNTGDVVFGEYSKAPEGATAGAAAGGALGAVIAGLSAAGSLTFPGLSLVAAGPIAAALAGAGTGGIAGALIGAVIGLGVRKRRRPSMRIGWKGAAHY